MVYIELAPVSSHNLEDPASTAAAFIGARVFMTDGGCSTDSSLVFELVELARHFEEFFLHCFVIKDERARDSLQLPSSVRLVDLGRITSGHELYGHPIRLWRRISNLVRRGGWSYAVHVEPGLISLLSLIACGLARRPSIALIRGDPAADAMAHRHYRGMQTMIGNILRCFRMVVERVLASSVAVVTDSDIVGARLGRRGTDVRHIAAASISEADVLPPGPGWHDSGSEQMRLLFVGRLERVKDVDTLLEAVHRVVEDGREVTLKVVGTGDPDYVVRLHSHVQQLGLEERVEFVGPLPHGPLLYECYQQAHILVLSSLSEGIPKVVIEAMAHGLPVVGTNVGGLSRLVTSETGILVPPSDADALGKAMIEIYDSPALSCSMGEAALQKAAGLLAEQVSKELASALIEIARPPRPRVGAMLWRPRREAQSD